MSTLGTNYGISELRIAYALEDAINFYLVDGTMPNEGTLYGISEKRLAIAIAENTSISGGGSTVWGAITGNLASQSDLSTALSLKQNTLANPTFTTLPTITNITNNSADTTDITLDTFGRYYYVVSTNATPPTAQQIKDGKDSADSIQSIKGATNFLPCTITEIDNISGLSSETDYYYYYVPEGAVKNLGTVGTLPFTTLSTAFFFGNYPALVGYSLRRLSSSATRAIRVRRSSDNAEQDIGFAGGILDTTSLLAFVGSSTGYVTKWYNQGIGGATYDVSQAVAGLQPIIVNNGVLSTENSKPAVSFNNTRLIGSFTVLPQPITVFGVARHTVHDGNGNSLFDSNNAINRFYGSFRSAINFSMSADNTAIAINITANTNRNLHYNLFNTTTSAAAINGNTPTTGNIGTNGLEGITIGDVRAGSFPSYHLNGTIQELIIYSSNQSANRTAIETNINTHYTIY